MFDAMLRDLLEQTPGARGVVFCDPLGEAVTCVGASGREEPHADKDFDLRVAGAQLAEPLDLARQHATQTIGEMREWVIRGTRETLLVHTLPEGYYLVACLRPGALVGRGLHHLRRVAAVVAREI